MLRRLIWLALGSFAIGTEGFMIAGLLPDIAGDVGVSIAACGQLVTVFSITYAVGAPILATLTGGFDRKRLLMASLFGFGLANIVAATATGYWHLMFARILLALCAGLFMPAANAVAVSLAPPEKRGTAISIVTGGITIAVALGAPLGTWIAALGDWRTTFLLVAVAAFIGVAGLAFGLPTDLPRSRISMAARAAVARRPEVLAVLGITTAAVGGAFTIYIYLAAHLSSEAGMGPVGIGLGLLVFGVAAAIGNSVGGPLADRIGPERTIGIGLVAIIGVLALISVAAEVLEPSAAGPIILVLIGVWGVIGWGIYPAIVSRLVQVARDGALVALSLNSSALYVGSASGAALGALVMATRGPADLGITGALCTALALGMLGLSLRLSGRTPRAEPSLQPAE